MQVEESIGFAVVVPSRIPHLRHTTLSASSQLCPELRYQLIDLFEGHRASAPLGMVLSPDHISLDSSYQAIVGQQFQIWHYYVKN